VLVLLALAFTLWAAWLVRYGGKLAQGLFFGLLLCADCTFDYDALRGHPWLAGLDAGVADSLPGIPDVPPAGERDTVAGDVSSGICDAPSVAPADARSLGDVGIPVCTGPYPVGAAGDWTCGNPASLVNAGKPAPAALCAHLALSDATTMSFPCWQSSLYSIDLLWRDAGSVPVLLVSNCSQCGGVP